jgi:CRP-like cAMP-binding protein
MASNFEANFFTLLELLDTANRLTVEQACTRIAIPAGQMIYRQGDPAGTVYIVASGVVEVLTESPDGQQSRCLGYIGRGDFFGDLAVLTGHPRFGSVRACDGVELLWIEKAMFLSLLEKVPKMGAFFSRNLARRLHKTATEAHLEVYSLDLSGNLRHFDLITLFQAIARMGNSGELHLNNAGNELIASYYFHEGRPSYARNRHLEGIEALWQGFADASTDGTFTFQVRDKPELPFSEENQIQLAGDHLLAEGIARREAYQTLPEPLRALEGTLTRRGEALEWSDPDLKAIATEIWALTAMHPQPLSSLWRRLHVSSLTFLEVVHQLITAEQVEWSTTAPQVEVPHA